MQPLSLPHPGLPGDLVLLAAERTVTVTREEHHQDVLAGRTGPTIAELRPCTITAGKHAGQDGLEVVLDGRRVGELTRLMAQRYRPMVDEVRSRGYRAGCEAVLAADARGIQVELRLPSATERRVTEPPTAPIMIPARSGASPWPGRPATAGSHAVPRQRRRPPGSTHGVPGPSAPAPYGVPAPPATTRRRSRRLLGVSAAVVGVLVLASALGNGSRDEVPAGNSSALPSAAAAPAVPAAVEPSPGDDERGAGRCCGRTRGTLDGGGPAARTRDVQAAHDVQACTPDRSGGPGARAEIRAEVVGLRLELRRLCPDRQRRRLRGRQWERAGVRVGTRPGHRYGQVRPRQRQGRHRLRVASPR